MSILDSHLDLMRSYGIRSIVQHIAPTEIASTFGYTTPVHIKHTPEYTMHIDQPGLLRLFHDLRRNYITRCIDSCGNQELKEEFDRFLVRAAMFSDGQMPMDDGTP